MHPSRRLALLLLVALFTSGFIALPAMARGASSGRGSIAFYGGILDVIDSHSSLLVRPSTFLLSRDGSVALVHLKWSGWGSNVARATGVMVASSCVPSCANGKLTKRPAQLTLSNPGVVYGHRVYRCYEVTPHRPHSGPFGHGCIRLEGKVYLYASGDDLQGDDQHNVMYTGYKKEKRRHQVAAVPAFMKETPSPAP